MARTPSTMLELNTPAPDFTLLEPASGKTFARDDFASAPGLLVMFLSNHCPYVQHIRQELARFANDTLSRGLAVVGINANDVEAYPDDSPEKMTEEVQQFGYAFPYLYDASQEVAKAYQAACTPDFFLFDADRKLVYRGQFDGARPGNTVPITGADLGAAVDSLLAGQALAVEQVPSLGCNIKWRPGNAPAYFG